MFAILYCGSALAFFYYIFIHPLNYWKKRGVPQQNAFQTFKDNFVSLFKRPGLAQVFENFCKSFPDARYFGMYMILGKTLVVRDPDLIKAITVKDFNHFMNHIPYSPSDEPLWERNLFSLKGNEWKTMRSILTPSFTGRKLKLMFSLMLENVENFVTYFENQLKTKECVTLEMKEIFTRFTNDVIASVAFGYSCDSLRNPNNEFFTAAKEIVPRNDFIQNLKTYLMFKAPKLAKFLGFTLFPKHLCEFFRNLIEKTLKAREDNNIVRHDMINLLIKEKKNLEESGADGSVLTISDITAHALGFFFSGVESVSTLMSFAAYELAINTDMQKRLQNEVDCTLKDCQGRSLTYEALDEMKYMDMILSETLRKWPSSVLTDRICTKAYEIKPEKPGEVSVYLEENDVLWMPIFAIHRDPKLFPNPELFDPERFNKDNKPSIHPYSYIPFGSGSRSCIANRFTLLETKLLFFHILSKFNIVVVKETQIPLKLSKFYFQLCAEGGFWLGLTLRK